MKTPRELTGRRNSFTLVEMTAVLALMALLASVVTLSLAGPRRAARMSSVTADLGACDRLVRDQARMTNSSVALQFDLDRGTVRRMDGRTSGESPPGLDAGATLLRLPAGYRLDQIATAKGCADSGVVDVTCSGAGLSQSYAVRISGPDGNQWVAVAGLSGQTRTNGARRR